MNLKDLSTNDIEFIKYCLLKQKDDCYDKLRDVDFILKSFNDNKIRESCYSARDYLFSELGTIFELLKKLGWKLEDL